MPPKPNAKKGDIEDFSDAASLPAANVFKFSILHKAFLETESRDKVKVAISDKLQASAGDRMRTLSREDIVTYGKAKGHIVDGASARGTEAEMLGKSAADRLFEMTALFRRARKERQQEPDFDADLVDGYIFMPDFPTTKDEVLALSKFGASLNAIFEIEELPKPPENDETDPESEEQLDESTLLNQTAAANDNQEARQIATDIIEAFRAARDESEARSPLRNLAFLRTYFQDVGMTYEIVDDTGATLEKTRSSEDCFIIDLMGNYVDKYAQYSVQYAKFKALVTAEPLMPDKKALRKINTIKLENIKQNAFIQDAQAELDATIKDLEDTKNNEGTDKGELEQTD